MHRDAKIAIYTIFGTMIAFKVLTGLWIVWQQPTIHATAFIVLTNAIWMPLVAIPISIVAIFWYRRIKVRRRRQRLIDAEWDVRDRVPSPSGLP